MKLRVTVLGCIDVLLRYFIYSYMLLYCIAQPTV